jgi:hypothetical protein
MTIVVQRTFVIEPGTLVEFERLSREGIWPYMEARGCKVLGLFTNMHGGPSNEVVLHTAYESLTHWEATRLDLPAPEGSSDALIEMQRAAMEAARQRHALTKVTSTRVLRLVTPWVELGVSFG